MIANIQATIFFDQCYWVGLFERTDSDGYEVARHVFGGEPTDAVVYAFVLYSFEKLRFGEKAEFTLEIKRVNPKRAQKLARREMEKLKDSQKPSTIAQDYMREELEKGKKEKQRRSSADKEERKKKQFALKQEKKKSKQRGK